MIELKDLGPILKKKRREGKISQTDIGNKLGLTKNHISDIERGIHKISVNILCGYCEMLGLTPNEILDIEPGDSILPELRILIRDMNEEEQNKLLAIAKLM